MKNININAHQSCFSKSHKIFIDVQSAFHFSIENLAVQFIVHMSCHILDHTVHCLWAAKLGYVGWLWS